MVVFASHSSSLRPDCGAGPEIPGARRVRAVSLTSLVSCLPARAGEPDRGVEQRGPDAAAGEGGIDKEHVDDVALEAGETGGLAVDERDQRQRAGEARAEGLGSSARAAQAAHWSAL